MRLIVLLLLLLLLLLEQTDQSALLITITLHLMAFFVEIDLLVAAAELKEKEDKFPLNFGSYITPRTKNWPIMEREITKI